MKQDAAYPEESLTPAERDEYEEDLIAVSDRELDLLGEIEGLGLLYAGGASLLWLEGLSLRVGERGTVTAVDSDAEKVGRAADLLAGADLEAPVRLVRGDVFDPPFAPCAFDLVYSAGLFHELDVSKGMVPEALAALASLVRPGGKLATSDFVDVVPAAQLDDEGLQADLARAISGTVSYYGIGPPERLVALHEQLLEDVRWRVSPPRSIRHLDKLVLAEKPDEPQSLPAETVRKLREGREALRERIRREGYTRPATLYVEGYRKGEPTG